MCQKLQQGHLHIAAFGKVSAGKSSLLNALLGRHEFQVSALHGETKHSKISQWQHQEAEMAGVHLIDPPGINEVDGEQREQMAHSVAQRSDLILLVTDGDFTDMMTGKLNPMQAYTSGKLIIEGDIMKSQLIEKLFDMTS